MLEVTVQVPVPEHPCPDQPINTDPAFGVAVSTIDPPSTDRALQVDPQFTPPPVTIPVPEPAFETLTAKAGLNSAVTVVVEVGLITHTLFVPEHPLVHSVNIDEKFKGVATTMIGAPANVVRLQVEIQFVPSAFTTIIFATF